MDALDALDVQVERVRQAAEDAARTEAAFKVAFARARMTYRARANGKVTADQAEDAATVATADLRLEYVLAREQLTAAREATSATPSGGRFLPEAPPPAKGA
jgi:hypothetical protein